MHNVLHLHDLHSAGSPRGGVHRLRFAPRVHTGEHYNDHHGEHRYDQIMMSILSFMKTSSYASKLCQLKTTTHSCRDKTDIQSQIFEMKSMFE